MTSRDMMEVASAWNGPFGKWFRGTLAADSKSVIDQAVRIIPANIEETNERERNFGKGLALAELLDQIPQKIKDEIKELEQKEQSSHE